MRETKTGIDNDLPNIKASVAQYMQRHANSQRLNQKLNQAYCYRHLPGRAPNNGANTDLDELEKQLVTVSPEDGELIKSVWNSFGVAPSAHRRLLLQGLLTQCCFPQLSDVSSIIRELIRIDFIVALPTELSLKILGYLDAKSLARAAEVSKSWKKLADDDVVWYHLCEQHIDRKCTTCGWGLPLLDRKSLRQSKKAVMERLETLSQAQPTAIESATQTADELNSMSLVCGASRKRCSDKCTELFDGTETSKKVIVEASSGTRPWKDVYIERYKIENNWRTGRHATKEFVHASSVLCLQFDDQYMITGTFDGTISIWCVETCKLVRTLKGHFRAVSALKFDATKLVTGSWDQSVRVWNYHTGQCICTFGGHDSKVLCIDFDGNLIAAGSADDTIKVWDFLEKSCFTLRGHTEPVHSVKIHAASMTLYTSSEDLTVRMWDLRTKTCIKVFGGPENGPSAHVAQIQQALPITLEHLEGEEDHPHPLPEEDDVTIEEVDDDLAMQRPTHLLTASLDNTIKVWDIRTGRCARTLFGHVEGVWCIAADHFRIVSGAHDKLVKVWDVQSGRCWHTFSGHAKPVCCVGLNDTGFASGGDDGMVKLHQFDI